MHIYLLEKHKSSKVPFKCWLHNGGGLKAEMTFFLRDKAGTLAERGVVTDQRFPWSVHSENSENERNFQFSVIFAFEKSNELSDPVNYRIFVEEEFREMLAYAYETHQIPRNLKLRINAGLSTVGYDASFGVSCVISPVFAAMVEGDYKEKKENKGVVDLSAEGIKAFLEYAYTLKVDKPQQNLEIAFDLLQFSNQKLIKELEKLMLDLLFERPDEFFDVDMALRIYDYVKTTDLYQKLYMKAVKVLKLKRDEVDDSPYYGKIFEERPEFARELVRILLSKK